jgi:hypothetical protein
LQHARDLTVFIPPLRAGFLIYVFQIRAIFQPHLHLVGRTNRHQKIAFELRSRPSPLAVTFGDVSADRFARSPDLIGETVLLDSWKLQ